MRVAVVTPCYKSREQVLDVLMQIGDNISFIIAVDDCCPEHTGKFIAEHCNDDRLHIEYHEENQGVGGACITGFKKALSLDADIIIKLDSDGQMAPKLIDRFIQPILDGKADYCKGNRFYDLKMLSQMPLVRLIGNAGLSFLSKFSTGYWDLMDPTNGFVAIHAKVLKGLPLERLNKRFFFETDMLFRLYTIRAKVVEIPMRAKYGGETSNLSVGRSIFYFFAQHCKRIFKRIFYNYFLRDFNIASINLFLGFILFAGGLFSGYIIYTGNQSLEQATPTGTIMMVMLVIMVGFQLLLSFINYDIQNTPKTPIHDGLPEYDLDDGESGGGVGQ
jgi:glycosyltransferase involved in cell wall biosynthesis